jgi:chitin disaccharide deacetylase
MGGERTLIVNADDFGQSTGVNAGVIEAHERGIVTSASLMVHWPAAPEAAMYARSERTLSIGLHLDLGQWKFVEGEWKADYERVSLSNRTDVEREVRDQLELFTDLVGREPTHLDSHQHVHLSEPAESVARHLARELGVVLRDRSRRVRHCGEFYGQTGTGEPYPEGISTDRLVELIETLPEGITELACHPGRGVRPEFIYAPERERELAALCDPRARMAIEHQRVVVRTFADIGEDPAASREPRP